MHQDELSVPLETARALIDAQFPPWRDLPVERVASPGTVNAIFRIGDRFAARFPLERRGVEAARQWLEREADAPRELLGRTRFPTPEPIAIGDPGAGYPLPWSVQTWVPGTVATSQTVEESMAFAQDLAEFIAGVRAIETRDRTFSGSGRGGDLQAHDWGWSGTTSAATRLRAGRASTLSAASSPTNRSW